MTMQILISGASVAGPVLAYWLTEYGFEVTVVERAPTLRKTGGHAVDLFRPAMQIVKKMGLLEQVRGKATGTETLVIHRAGAKPVTVDLRKLYTAVSDDHVEIMRDDLSEIFYDATRDNVEYVFADSITSISDDGEVAFEHGQSRRFDVIVGADGLHSNVQALTFGPEAGFSTWIGAYLSVVSMPNYLNLDSVMETIAEVGRIAGVYSAAHLDDARAVFLFRTPEPLQYHHRDAPRQKQLLREHFADTGWEVPRLLAALDDTGAFYFDSITQLRLDTWSRPRHIGGRCRLLPGTRRRWQHQPCGRRCLYLGVRARHSRAGSQRRVRGVRARDRRLCEAQPHIRGLGGQEGRAGPSARSLDSCARGAVDQRAAGIGQPCDRETQFRQHSSA
jgi:2-polyprenyl-6-methoxyphenol hydroxylase-like FAD-dependent oxidoreductase